MHRDQGGGAGGIHADRGAAEIVHVGHAVSDDGAGGALRTWADGTHKHGFKQVKKSIGDGIDEGERNINDATDGSKHSNGALKINRN